MRSHSLKVSLSVLLSMTPLMLKAEVGIQSDATRKFATVCEALQTASSGDVVTISGKEAITAGCVWTTPGVTLQGADATASIDAGGTWTISADDTIVRNLEIAGSGVELGARNLTLSNVRIHGAAVGVRTADAAAGTLIIEDSDLYDNGTNIEVSSLERLVLLSSCVRDARSGDSVVARAAVNELRGNRFASGEEGASARDLVLYSEANNFIVDNVFLKSAGSGPYPLIQYITGADQPGQLEVASNTFVSQYGKGTNFIEVLGEKAAQAVLRKNIFWGQGSVDASLLSDTQENYFGTDDIFVSESDFRLNGTAPRPDWGANVARREIFPFVAVSSRPVAVSRKNVHSEAAIGALMQGVILQSSSVTGASLQFSNRVTLGAPAPSGGTVVSISSSNPAAAKPWTASVTVPAGQTTATFMLQTYATSSMEMVTITATAGSSSATAQLSVGSVSLSRIVVESTSVGSGLMMINNRIDMTGPVSGNTTVTLTSSSPLVTVPPTVTIPSSSSSNGFVITAGVVASPINVTITATHATGKKTVNITIMPVTLRSITASPIIVAGGNWGALKLVLNGPAPAAGLPVSLTSSDPRFPVPSLVVVPAGKVEQAINTKTAYVSANTPVTITATSDGVSASTSLTLVPTALNYMVANTSTIKARGSLLFVIQMNGPAPVGGLPIVLSSTNSGAVSVPGSVTVPAGLSYATFYATGGQVTTPTAATVSASALGVSRSVTVTAIP